MDHISGTFRFTTVAHVVAILGAVLTAGGVWLLTVGFQLAGSTPSRGDYVVEAQGLAVTAALLLLLGPVCVAGLGGGRATLAAYLAAGALVSASAVFAYAERTTAELPDPQPFLYAVQYVFLLPTTYPLILLTLTALWRSRVRGSSSPAPR